MRTQTVKSSTTNALEDNAIVYQPYKRGKSSEKAMFLEETLIVDERSFRRPAKAVEDRLSQMLESACVGISNLRLKHLLNLRTERE